MEEVRLSWLEGWYLSNDTVNTSTDIDIRIHYGGDRKVDIKGKGCDDIILYILNTTEKDDVLWITQYPKNNSITIGIRK